MAQMMISEDGDTEEKKKKNKLLEKAQAKSIIPQDNKNIIESAKPVVQQAIKDAKGLSSKEKKEVIKNIENPKKMESIAKKDNPSKLSDQFTQALTYFAPQLIGGLGGALFGGEEAALEGMSAGGAMRDSYIDYLQKEEELKMKRDRAMADAQPKAKTFQQAKDSFIKGPNGEFIPALMDPNTGSLVDPISKQIITDPTKLHTGEQRRTATFQMDVKQKGSLSDKQVESVKGFETSLSAMDTIDNLKSGVETGAFAGRAQGVGEIFGLSSEQFTQLKAETENVKAEFLKAMSGAQVSEQEARRLANIIPNTNDDDNVFIAKSKQFREVLERHKAQIMHAIQTGQPLKKDTIDAMLREAGVQRNEQKNSSALERIKSRSEVDNKKRLQELRNKYKGRR